MIDSKHFSKIVFILSCVLLFVRLLFILNTYLVDDEAYYAMYARHLSWGYIDHGPVVAFVIWIFTQFSESSFTVRLGSVLLMTLLPYLLYIYVRKYINTTSALVVSLLVSANLLFHTNSIIITPDVPLAFFSITSILFYYIAYFKNENFIYLGGMMLGLAILSKVSALFPAIGIVLFPIIIKEKRYWLKNIHYYGSFILSFALFIPFVVWNFQNDMAFVRYQGSHIAQRGGFNHFIELWLGVALLIGPLYFYYSIFKPITNLKNWKILNNEKKYFTLVTVVPLFYFVAHSLFSRFELNWVAPVFFGGLFLLGVELDSLKKVSKAFTIQIIYSLALISLIMIQTFYPILPLKGKSDPTNRYFMYNNLIEDTKNLLIDNEDLNGLRIVSNEFQIPSMINFYLNPKMEAICLSIDYHETLYSFLYEQESLLGKDFIYIHDKEEFPEKIKPYFDSYELILGSEESRNNSSVASYTVWLVKNYAGKL